MYTSKSKLSAAIGLALLSSQAAAAPSFAWTEVAYSLEGSASATSFTAPAVTVTMGAEYAKDDLIALTFNSALSADPASTLTALKPCVDSTGTNLVPSTAENGGTMTLGLISNTSTSATYRITNTNNTVTNAGTAGSLGSATVCDANAGSPASTIGATVGLGTLTFGGAALNALGTLTGSYSATLSNGVTALDGGSASIKDVNVTGTADDTLELIEFGAQYSKLTTDVLLNGIIDVAASPTRTALTASTDVLTIDIGENTTTTYGTTLSTAASGTDEVVTTVITGDFSYLADENTGTTGVQNDSIVATCAASASTETFNDAKTTVTVVCASGDVGDVVVTTTPANNGVSPFPAIIKGAFTYSTSMTYIDSGTDLNNAIDGNDVAGTKTLSAAGTSAGAFTLNGSTSTVQAYPVGAGIDNFLWVTNSAATDGDITMTATQGGATSAECSLGTAAAKTLTSVSAAANTCLTAAGITSGRAQLALTVNATATLVNVYAAYKVESANDRLALTVTDGITD